MLVAITGGTGFIGSKLVDRHIAEGHNIRVLTRKQITDIDESEQVELFQADLIADSGSLMYFLEDVDIFYNCAGEISEIDKMQVLHIEGTRNLLNAAAGQSKKIHWVQLSSAGVYGPIRSGIVNEETKTNPVGDYEITKLGADILIGEAATNGYISATILRPSNVFGPGMQNHSLSDLISAVNRRYFFYVGNKTAKANYIYVDNVIEALILCGSKTAASFKTYNLSDYLALSDFINIIASELGRPKPKIRLPEKTIRTMVRFLSKFSSFPLTSSRIDALTIDSIYSNESIENDLGYQHPVSMENAIRRMVHEWIKQN